MNGKEDGELLARKYKQDKSLPYEFLVYTNGKYLFRKIKERDDWVCFTVYDDGTLSDTGTPWSKISILQKTTYPELRWYNFTPISFNQKFTQHLKKLSQEQL